MIDDIFEDSGAHHALIEPVPMLLGQQSGAAARPVDQPTPTVATAGAISLVEPFVFNIGQTSAKDRYGLLEPFMVKCCHGGGDGRRTMSLKDPVPALTCSNENAIIHATGLDIRFRMLKNHELKRAQGFPDNYILTGNTTEQTKQIGNAVPVKTAKALALAAMSA